MNLRINKLLSQIGLGSRRECEEFILDGRVYINNDKAELSDIVEEDDTVTLDGEELPVREAIRDYVSEQKMNLSQKSIRIGNSYISVDDEEEFWPNKKIAGSKTQKASSLGFSKKNTGGKVAKFRKNRDEDAFFDSPSKRKEKISHKEKTSKFGGRAPKSRDKFDSDSDFFLKKKEKKR